MSREYSSDLHCRRLPKGKLAVFLMFVLAGLASAQVILETRLFGIRLEADGQVASVFVKPENKSLTENPGGNAFLWLRKDGKTYRPSALKLEGDRLTATFASENTEAVLRVGTLGAALDLRVLQVTGDNISELVFADLTLPESVHKQGWGVTVGALNEYTKGIGHPGMNRSGRASCFSHFGFEWGRAAILVARRDTMRDDLKTVVEQVPDLPKSPIGGPFAMDAPDAYGSYLFAGGNVTEENVDGVVELADRLGLNQINLHAVRYGDWKPYEKQYPGGRTNLKRVVDQIHAAGMLAGIHTYSEFINKSSRYVTPVPDRRLGVDAVFTLSEPLDVSAKTVPVVESTAEMSAVTGFFVRNSATVRIDDELIVYSGASKIPPFVFTECRRGAYGTKVTAHAKGAKVHHLRECFGLFLPDGESTLFTEVAHNLADLINECGFDMVYLDALDGSDAVAGRTWSWHYAAKFTLEIFRHLNRPVLAEMSTFPHHLWYVRSRSGAWDHPNRSHKTFIDIHAQANRKLEDIFLPSHLGWWRYKTWQSFSQEPTYDDDIEHLGVRCLGWNSGVSIQGVSATTLRTVPALTRLSAITRRYEVLRRAHYFDDATLARLREPDTEFALRQTEKGKWNLLSSACSRHKVTALDNGSQRWTVENNFGKQTSLVRIETLYSVGPYEATDDCVLADFATADEFGNPRSVKTVKASLERVGEPVQVGTTSLQLTAANEGEAGAPSWARWEKVFDPSVNLADRQALGVWVHGDGKGEILNLQLRSPVHMTRACGEHYVKVDFTGWKYFELVEPDGEAYRQAIWPYSSWYAVYRETPRYNAIRELNLYVNNVSPGDTAQCALSPIRGLPLIESPIVNPRLSFNGRTVLFPVTINTGYYLEYDGDRARLFGRQGELLEVLSPQGDALLLQQGDNTVEFACEAPGSGIRPRAMVTIGRYGEALPNTRKPGDVKWNEVAREVDLPHQIIALDGEQNCWNTISREGQRRASLDLELVVQRLEADADAYDRTDALVVDSFDDLTGFADSADNRYLQYVRSGSRVGLPTSEGVTHALSLECRSKKFGAGSFRYTAKSTKDSGWSARGRRFTKPLDLTEYTHIGFWVKGDSQGETLYFQFRDKKGGHFDMKTAITFKDWRFVSFDLQKRDFDFSAVDYLILYYNGLPANREVSCQVDAMRAYTVGSSFRNPVLKVGRRKLRFPVELRSGDVLAYHGDTETCEVRRGAERIVVKPKGKSPMLRKGVNRVELTGTLSEGSRVALTAQIMKRYRDGK